MKERIENALTIAFNYGQIDGDHHKTWVIDQMVRALCGTEERYNEWIAIYREPEEGSDPDDYYEWDTGIAP